MLKLKRLLLTVLTVALYVGCSDVDFKATRSDKCKNFSGKCVIAPDGNYELSGSVKAGRVDILFIDDNSGSMYVEQSKMADRFPHFLSSIGNLDYQIAIITTDVSASPGNNVPRPANGHGAFQDGKFLKFPNGQTIIGPSTPDVVNQFRSTIKRQETLDCEQNGYKTSHCPSGDERPIYAANMALDRANLNFFRHGAHLAMVILSDENERTNGGQITGYPLEDYDLPETLVSKVGQILGPEKVLSVHSVIIKPGDNSCLTAQNNQGPNIKGFEGHLFKALSLPSADLKSKGNIVKGAMGSICANDYGQQLGDIGSVIKQNVNMIQLACEPLIDKDTNQTTLQVSFNPPPPQQITFTVDSSHRLILDPPAPVGTTVSYSYRCPRHF